MEPREPLKDGARDVGPDPQEPRNEGASDAGEAGWLGAPRLDAFPPPLSHKVIIRSVCLTLHSVGIAFTSCFLIAAVSVVVVVSRAEKWLSWYKIHSDLEPVPKIAGLAFARYTTIWRSYGEASASNSRDPPSDTGQHRV